MLHRERHRKIGVVSRRDKWKGHFSRDDHAIKRLDFRERGERERRCSGGERGSERVSRDGARPGGGLGEKEKEKTRNTPSRGICWALLRGLFGSSPVVRGRHRFPSLAHLPFRSPFSAPPLSIPLVRTGRESERGGRGAPFMGGLARVCHSVMDDSTPTRSIRLPRVYMPRG